MESNCLHCKFATLYDDGYAYCGKIESPRYSLILQADNTTCEEWRPDRTCDECAKFHMTYDQKDWETFGCEYYSNLSPGDSACAYYKEGKEDGREM